MLPALAVGRPLAQLSLAKLVTQREHLGGDGLQLRLKGERPLPQGQERAVSSEAQ